jgi:hypothetical protein
MPLLGNWDYDYDYDYDYEYEYELGIRGWVGRG